MRSEALAETEKSTNAFVKGRRRRKEEGKGGGMASK